MDQGLYNPHRSGHHLFLLKERARDKAEGAGDDAAEGDGEGDSDGEGKEGTGRHEEDGLESEVLRGKSMDVASMDALKKRIEVRMPNLCLVSLRRNILGTVLTKNLLGTVLGKKVISTFSQRF